MRATFATHDWVMRLVVACALLLAGPAHAQLLRPGALCSAMADVHLAAYAQFVADALEEADQSFVRQKRRSMTAALSDNGLTGVVAMVMARCKENPTATIKLVTASVYLDLRQAQDETGRKR